MIVGLLAIALVLIGMPCLVIVIGLAWLGLGLMALKAIFRC